jgi:hypothetical protein
MKKTYPPILNYKNFSQTFSIFFIPRGKPEKALIEQAIPHSSQKLFL